jgi:hypothetical protein
VAQLLSAWVEPEASAHSLSVSVFDASDSYASPFKSLWSAERMPGGYVIKDVTGQALAYVWGLAEGDTAKVLTMDEARRVARTSPSCQTY